MRELKVRLTLTEEALGMTNPDEKVMDRFIAKNAPDAKSRDEEIHDLVETEGIEEARLQNSTVFPRADFGEELGVLPFMYDYQIRGFFKDACGMLHRVDWSLSSKYTAHKKKIDGLIFVKERRIPIVLPKGKSLGICQRPLRAQTPQGERVALASSETVPEGSTLEFTVQVFNDSDLEIVKEWLDYGQFRGLCQWRNSGKGTFTWEEIELSDAVNPLTGKPVAKAASKRGRKSTKAAAAEIEQAVEELEGVAEELSA